MTGNRFIVPSVEVIFANSEVQETLHSEIRKYYPNIFPLLMETLIKKPRLFLAEAILQSDVYLNNSDNKSDVEVLEFIRKAKQVLPENRQYSEPVVLPRLRVEFDDTLVNGVAKDICDSDYNNVLPIMMATLIKYPMVFIDEASQEVPYLN